jgi:hypothetical protein
MEDPMPDANQEKPSYPLSGNRLNHSWSATPSQSIIHFPSHTNVLYHSFEMIIGNQGAEKGLLPFG